MVNTPRWANLYFQPDSLTRVERAIEQAESRTVGQIVPMVVRQSSATRHVVWLCWALLAFSTLAVERVVEAYFWNLQFQILGATGAAILLALPFAQWLSKFSRVRRFFTADRDETEQARRRAELEFYRHGLNQTQGGTGILLFVSLMEHRAVVLADRHIAEHYDQGTWDQVVAHLTAGARAGDLGQGFERAVERCGEILAQRLPKPEAATNELANHLIFVE